MLAAHHLSKSYGIHSVLQDITFNVNPGERVGLIGPNGCGKTTLLRILVGLEMPDSGKVAVTRPDLRIGYLSQGFEFPPDLSIAEVCTLQPAPMDQSQITDLAASLAADPSDRDLQAQYDALIDHLSAPHQPDEILIPLGLADIPRDRPVASLSGGQKTRLKLARLLLDLPDLILLDEPTNHLDIAMLEWLEDWLGGFHGAALIVSHDRAFLDHTVSRILDLDPDSRTVRAYPGNYSQYLEQFLAEREKQWDEYRDQVAEVRRMRQDIIRTKQQALSVELTTTSRQPGVRRYAKKVAKKALSR
jgi:ATP-binding cassette subfamily F protein 3